MTGSQEPAGGDVPFDTSPGSYGSQAEVCRFFAGLELIEPGIVQVHRWRPGTGDLGSGRNLAIYAGVGRKP